MRIAAGMIFQETDSFSPVLTTKEQFDAIGWRTDTAMFNGLPEGSELGGLVDECGGRDDIELIGTVATAAWPGGPVEAEIYENIHQRIVQGIKDALPLDGIFLALHGSMVAETEDDPEGRLLRELRVLVGPDLPIAVTLDLHANVTRAMAEHASVICGYHCNPHTDQRDTGRRAARALLALADGKATATTAFRKLPTIAAGNSQMTAFPCDYQNIYAFCAEQEARPEVLACSNFSVHVWLDVDELGWSQVVVTDNDRALADELADTLAQMAWDMRGTGNESFAMMQTTEAVIDKLSDDGDGLVVIADTGDTVNAGAAGDSTVLLRSLLEANLQDQPIYLPITDPAAVDRLYDCATGEEVTLSIGAGLATEFFEPLELTGTLVGKHEGRVVIGAGTGEGTVMDRGRTVVFGIGEMRLVLSERPSPGHPQEVYTSVGLNPADARAVVVKSLFPHVAAYGDVAGEFVWVNTPGPTLADVRALPYTKVPRPLFPLDEVDDWRD